MNDFKDAVVVVTGAATGIGRALAVEAGARGARVMASDLTAPDGTAEAVRAAGGVAEAAVCDVTDYAQVAALAEATLRAFGTVNLLCNNAGVGVSGTLDAITPEDFARTLDVDVRGMFHGVHAFLPALRAAVAAGGHAHILNVGSEHALGVPPHAPAMSAYTTAKFAVLGLSECLRRDLDAEPIGVTLLCPSWVRTENLEQLATRSPAFAAVLDAHAQTTAEVAAEAFDAVAGGVYLAATNRANRGFGVTQRRTLIEAIEAY